MPTNLAIDDKLLNEATAVGAFKSKREAVNTALLFFIKAQRRKKILGLFGKVELDPDYNYKKSRERR